MVQHQKGKDRTFSVRFRTVGKKSMRTEQHRARLNILWPLMHTEPEDMKTCREK